MVPSGQDPVALTLAQICEVFTLKPSVVRSWIQAGKIQPVKRGSGKGRPLYFARGEVVPLVQGICRLCGEPFKRANQRQEFCGKSCRQKWSRRANG